MHRPIASDVTPEGLFTDGDGASILGSVCPASWGNMVTLEMEAFLDEAGITPDSDDNTQVLQAVKKLIGRNSSRNALINGDFRFAQRRLSANFANAGALSGFVCDRWLAQCDAATGAGTCTVSRQALTIGSSPIPGAPRYFLRFQQTAMATLAAPTLVQKIESVIRWSDGSCTASGWVKGSSSFDITLNVVQNFGTGGGSADVAVGTATVPVTTTWTFFEATFDLPSVLGKVLGSGVNDHLRVEFAMPMGLLFTCDYADMQHEPGTSASQFDRRPDPIEAALAMRYYEKTTEMDTPPDAGLPQLGSTQYRVPNGDAALVTIFPLDTRFLVEKRSLPAIVWYGGQTTPAAAGKVFTSAGDIAVSATLNTSTKRTGWPQLASSLAATNSAWGKWAADAEL